MTQTEHFTNQLLAISRLAQSLHGKKFIISGDFNLDGRSRHSLTYRCKHLFELQNNLFDDLNLIQQINFATWQRTVNNENRESILDHVYVQDPTIITEINTKISLIGDHRIVTFKINAKPDQIEQTIKRNWHAYTKEKLNHLLSSVDFSFEAD